MNHSLRGWFENLHLSSNWSQETSILALTWYSLSRSNHQCSCWWLVVNMLWEYFRTTVQFQLSLTPFFGNKVVIPHVTVRDAHLTHPILSYNLYSTSVETPVNYNDLATFIYSFYGIKLALLMLINNKHLVDQSRTGRNGLTVQNGQNGQDSARIEGFQRFLFNFRASHSLFDPRYLSKRMSTCLFRILFYGLRWFIVIDRLNFNHRWRHITLIYWMMANGISLLL